MGPVFFPTPGTVQYLIKQKNFLIYNILITEDYSPKTIERNNNFALKGKLLLTCVKKLIE